MRANRNRRIGITVLGDHPLIRERLKELIDREPDLVVRGEARGRLEALEVIGQKPPRLVITDLNLKDANALDLIKDIHPRWPELGILVFSMQEEALYAERVLRAGARGYITETEVSTKLMEAVRRILKGGIYMSESIAAQIARKSVTNSTPVQNRHSVDFLTDRELEVFGCIGQGYSTPEIAQRLHIHPKTVETYRARIKEKLGLDGAHQLLQHAIRWNKSNFAE